MCMRSNIPSKEHVHRTQNNRTIDPTSQMQNWSKYRIQIEKHPKEELEYILCFPGTSFSRLHFRDP
jgi:hypothetical protein